MERQMRRTVPAALLVILLAPTQGALAGMEDFDNPLGSAYYGDSEQKGEAYHEVDRDRTDYVVDAWDKCVIVENNERDNVFVPTRSSEEFEAFRRHHSGKVILKPCFQEVDAYCPEGIFDPSDNLCHGVGVQRVEVYSDWVQAASCNDHFGTVYFYPQAASNRLRVRLYNYGPGWRPGKNCPYKWRDMGTMELERSDGKPIAGLNGIHFLTYQYSSWGSGCVSRSGTTQQQGQLLSYCPQGGQQYPSFRVRAYGTAEINQQGLTWEPECPGGTLRSGGKCYADLRGNASGS